MIVELREGRERDFGDLAQVRGCDAMRGTSPDELLKVLAVLEDGNVISEIIVLVQRQSYDMISEANFRRNTNIVEY